MLCRTNVIATSCLSTWLVNWTCCEETVLAVELPVPVSCTPCHTNVIRTSFGVNLTCCEVSIGPIGSLPFSFLALHQTRRRVANKVGGGQENHPMACGVAVPLGFFVFGRYVGQGCTATACFHFPPVVYRKGARRFVFTLPPTPGYF